MTGNVVSIRDRLDLRWKVYLEAQSRAQQSHSIEDGIAAGRAWRDWLSLFMSAEQRSFVDGSRGGMIG